MSINGSRSRVRILGIHPHEIPLQSTRPDTRNFTTISSIITAREYKHRGVQSADTRLVIIKYHRLVLLRDLSCHSLIENLFCFGALVEAALGCCASLAAIML